jgi:metal-responsive CopG/Arc/MetJ family transcriptional regulator
MLQRRQLMLDGKVTLELMAMAQEEGKSFSELTREMLAEKIAERKKAKKRAKKRDAIEMMLESAKRLEKLGLGGAVDSSTNDDYIYR